MQSAAPRAHRAGTTPSWLGKRNSSRSTSIAMDGRRNRYVRCVCVSVCVCVWIECQMRAVQVAPSGCAAIANTAAKHTPLLGAQNVR